MSFRESVPQGPSDSCHAGVSCSQACKHWLWKLYWSLKVLMDTQLSEMLWILFSFLFLYFPSIRAFSRLKKKTNKPTKHQTSSLSDLCSAPLHVCSCLWACSAPASRSFAESCAAFTEAGASSTCLLWAHCCPWHPHGDSKGLKVTPWVKNPPLPPLPLSFSWRCRVLGPALDAGGVLYICSGCCKPSRGCLLAAIPSLGAS